MEEQLAEPSEIDVKAFVADPEKLTDVRTKLSDISWFMRALAEPIARMSKELLICCYSLYPAYFLLTHVAPAYVYCSLMPKYLAGT